MTRKVFLSILPAFLLALILAFPFQDRPVTIETKEKLPNDWFMRQRAFPFDQVNHRAYMTALQQAQELKTAAMSQRDESVWELAGPVNTGGRLTDVEMHPTDINIAYIGLLAPRHRRERLLPELVGQGAPLEGRVQGPAGLDIGGRGPGPIALSIVAQVQKVLAES